MDDTIAAQFLLLTRSEGQSSPEVPPEVPPWLFRHADLVNALTTGAAIEQAALRNTINHLHFKNQHLLVHLRDKIYGESILVKAWPEPCTAGVLECRWAEDTFCLEELENYEFSCLLMDDGQFVILATGTPHKMNRALLKVRLPEEAYAVGHRRAVRFPAQGVEVELSRNGLTLGAKLMDFSAMAFRVRVNAPRTSFLWLNGDEPLSVRLTARDGVLFFGPCRILRRQDLFGGQDLVLAPIQESITHFESGELANPPQILLPAPMAVFRHPLSARNVRFEITEISTRGFSVRERPEAGVLFPGLIIPKLKLVFAGTLKLLCRVQVVSRNWGEGRIHCHCQFLDMDLSAYRQLNQIVARAADARNCIATEVDMDDLWEFFFDTGFIYPKKYGLIQSHGEEFRETYRKLYQELPEVGAHFTFQENGRIYGHMAMVRAYDKAWLIQHHASRPMEGRRPGFVVLKQMMHYMNDMHRLPSARIDHVMCFYRPENKFPARVFGGFAEECGDPQVCSEDLFSYLPHTKLSLGKDLPEGWQLAEAQPVDVWNLRRFYARRSGGLLLDAIVSPAVAPGAAEALGTIFQRCGFHRNVRVLALKRNNSLHALFVLDESDIGLNLSELLNSVKILIVRPAETEWPVLAQALGQLLATYRIGRVPVLFYPHSYVEQNGIPFEKCYQLWIFDIHHVHRFLEYVQRRFHLRI